MSKQRCKVIRKRLRLIGRGAVLSRAATTLRSIETQPRDQETCPHGRAASWKSASRQSDCLPREYVQGVLAELPRGLPQDAQGQTGQSPARENGRGEGEQEVGEYPQPDCFHT